MLASLNVPQSLTSLNKILYLNHPTQQKIKCAYQESVAAKLLIAVALFIILNQQ